MGFWLRAGRRENVSEQQSRGSKNSDRLASFKERGWIQPLSMGVSPGPFLKFPFALLFAQSLFHVVGIIGYKTGSEATESLIVPIWVLSSTCKALGSFSGSKEGSAGAPGMNIGLTPRSQHSMNKRQGKIVFILNPRWRGHVIY